MQEVTNLLQSKETPESNIIKAAAKTNVNKRRRRPAKSNHINNKSIITLHEVDTTHDAINDCVMQSRYNVKVNKKPSLWKRIINWFKRCF